MVGQRLVDTMCREAQRGGSSQSLLCKSNHLCALLKQLAVATKRAALHFPDKKALHEAQEFAKELAQRAQHFRISLDLWESTYQEYSFVYPAKDTALFFSQKLVSFFSHFLFDHVQAPLAKTSLLEKFRMLLSQWKLLIMEEQKIWSCICTKATNFNSLEINCTG